MNIWTDLSERLLILHRKRKLFPNGTTQYSLWSPWDFSVLNDFPSVALYYKSMCKPRLRLSLGKNKAKDEPNIVRWDLPVR